MGEVAEAESLGKHGRVALDFEPSTPPPPPSSILSPFPCLPQCPCAGSLGTSFRRTILLQPSPIPASPTSASTSTITNAFLHTKMLHVEAQYLISRGRKRIERREGKRVRVCPSGCIFTDGPTVLHINAVFCYLYFVSHQCFP